AELFDFDRELLAECGAHALGDGARCCRVVIDVRVVTKVCDGLSGLLDHQAALPACWNGLRHSGTVMRISRCTRRSLCSINLTNVTCAGGRLGTDCRHSHLRRQRGGWPFAGLAGSPLVAPAED